jgi:hypothetical protein
MGLVPLDVIKIIIIFSQYDTINLGTLVVFLTCCTSPISSLTELHSLF